MINVAQKRKSTPAVGQANKMAAGSNNLNNSNQNKRAPPKKKKTKSSSMNKPAANQQQPQPQNHNQQQQQQQPQMVQMNNQTGQCNDDQVWIFGLINNIEQLLATFNSVNNQSSLQQQQQHQQHLSFSNKSPPSGYSTPSALPSPFILSSSSCSSSYSSAQSTSNSPVCSPKLSNQMTSSNLYANQTNNNNNSNQTSLFGATIGQQQQQQQVIGLQQSTQSTNHPQHQQQQLPRSPISRQIKFHEYKGPPQVKRPANNNQKQSNGSTSSSQKAPTSSSSSSATSNTSNGVQGKANNANTNNKTMATNQIMTTLEAPLVVNKQQPTDCNNNNNNKNADFIRMNVNSLETVNQMNSMSHQPQHQQPTTTTTLCLNKMTSFSSNNQMIPNQTMPMLQAQAQARQEVSSAQLFRVAPITPSLGTQIISSSQQQQTIYVSPTTEVGNCGQQQFVVVQGQPQQQQYQAHLSASNCNYLTASTNQEQFSQQGNFAANFGGPNEQRQQQHQEEELAMMGTGEDTTQQFGPSMMTSSEPEESTNQFVDSYSLMGADQMEMPHDMADDDDTCDIEPTICFSNGQNSANYDETLLFSEYIDLQDIPMNVNESDWLKKFLPPCSMS